MSSNNEQPEKTGQADTASGGQTNTVSGSQTGASKDQARHEQVPGGDANLASQRPKLISGRFSPAAHLDRSRIRK